MISSAIGFRRLSFTERQCHSGTRGMRFIRKTPGFPLGYRKISICDTNGINRGFFFYVIEKKNVLLEHCPWRVLRDCVNVPSIRVSA